VRQYTYDNLGGARASSLDPAGLNLSTTYTYDKNNNVLQDRSAQQPHALRLRR